MPPLGQAMVAVEGRRPPARCRSWIAVGPAEFMFSQFSRASRRAFFPGKPVLPEPVERSSLWRAFIMLACSHVRMKRTVSHSGVKIYFVQIARPAFAGQVSVRYQPFSPHADAENRVTRKQRAFLWIARKEGTNERRALALTSRP